MFRDTAVGFHSQLQFLTAKVTSLGHLLQSYMVVSSTMASFPRAAEISNPIGGLQVVLTQPSHIMTSMCDFVVAQYNSLPFILHVFATYLPMNVWVAPTL